MAFSERYGYQKTDISALKEGMPDRLRTKLWNFLYELLFKPKYSVTGDSYYDDRQRDFVRMTWSSFFGQDLRVLDDLGADRATGQLQKHFAALSWYEVYDFMEFFLEAFSNTDAKAAFAIQINRLLEQERVPYRIIDCLVVPLTSDEEIAAIENALDAGGRFKSAREHLEKAVSLFSDRANPDYANSIKESISSLESLVQIILGEKGTLGQLIEKLDIHPALKEGFKKLYGWTCDDGGIRHGKSDQVLEPESAEARYMLGTASAFFNYIIETVASDKERLDSN